MARRHKTTRANPTLRRIVVSLCRSLASLQLAVVLIVAVAAVLAWATFLEAAKGKEYTQWYVYNSQWFIVLLGLLAINILAATVIRFPWKKRQTGFVITHVGLLLLLVGSIQTFMWGVDGQLSFVEGQTADAILKTDRSQLTTYRQGPSGPPAAEFSFDAGPVDWQEGKTLDFDEADGIGVKVLKFHRHARLKEDWIADENVFEGPAIRLALLGPDGEPVKEGWLAANQFGRETSVGPIRVALQPVSIGSMLDDFLKPPPEDTGKQGVLSVHYEDKMYRLRVQENIGKKVPVGDSGIKVKIVEYLSNAKPVSSGRFASRGEEPKNPMLELRVYLRDKEEPIRQIAFAKHPLLNLDGVHGWVCPVKFFYCHPATSARTGVEFIQAIDGKLYCRTSADGKYEQRGEVKQGDRIKASADFDIFIVEYLPRARREVSFQPIQLAPGETGGPEAAALVEVATGGRTQQVWLQRDNEDRGFQRIETPQGPMLLTFGYERFPLGFSLKLLDFTRGMNPGRMGNASFSSSVRLVDPDEGIREERGISMNQPLRHRKFRFYQSGFQELPDGKAASILSVAYDPGRLVKYLGSLMICVGIFVMSFMKGGFVGKLLPSFSTCRNAVANASGAKSSPQQSSNPDSPLPNDRPVTTEYSKAG